MRVFEVLSPGEIRVAAFESPSLRHFQIGAGAGWRDFSLVQKFVKMSSQKLVDHTAWRRIEDIDSSPVMAKNDSVLTDS
jgi:hypothetical protein